MVRSTRSRQSPTEQRPCQFAHLEAADVDNISSENDLYQSQVREPVERVHVAAALHALTFAAVFSLFVLLCF